MRLRMILEAVDRASGPFRRLSALFRRAGVDQERLRRIQERAIGTARRLGAALGAAAGGLASAAVTGGLGIIMLAGRFEQFGVQLENTMGSAAGAERALKWVRKFAASTPYEIEEVTAAFVRAKAVGIDPFSGAMQNLGDAASGTSKTIMDAVEAVADAQTGEFERLKDFLITTSSEGGKVTFSYVDKAGKQASKSVKKSALEIQGALLGIFNERYGGLMLKQSKTLFGLWSNLKDRISSFGLDVADAGLFDFVKGELIKVSAWVDKLAANGTLAKWAKILSEKLQQLGKWLASIDWEGVGKTVWAFAGAIWSLMTFVGWLSEKLMSIPGLDDIFDVAMVVVIWKISAGFYGLATALGLVSIAGLPLWAVVAVVGVLAFAAYRLMRNWDKVTGFFDSMWARVKQTFANAATAIWNMMPAWLRGVFTGAKFLLNVAGGVDQKTVTTNRQLPGRAGARPAVGRAGGAKVAVTHQLIPPPGWQVRQQAVSAQGDVAYASVSRRFRPETGRSMAGAG